MVLFINIILQMKFTYNEKAQLQMENEKLRDELQKVSDQFHSSEDVVRYLYSFSYYEHLNKKKFLVLCHEMVL